MDLEKFTDQAKEILMQVQEILKRYKHNQMDTEHLLLAMLERPDNVAYQVFEKLGINIERMRQRVEAELARAPKVYSHGAAAFQDMVYITPQANQVFAVAAEESKRWQDSLVAVEHLLLGLIRAPGSGAGRILREFGVTQDKVEAAIRDIRGGQRVTDERAESRYRALERFSRDLTQMAREGKLDPVIGREDEIRRVIEVLSRRTKNNPALIGEPGVGKTAIVEGLAQKIVRNEVPEILKGKRVIALDLGAMVAGSKFRGEFEERLKSVMDEIRKSRGGFIVFIDELHNVVGAGAAEGAIDASNMLKPALAKGELQCVGATTLDEYRKYIEKDSALERRFQPVYVDEPTVEETIEILKGLREKYEEHHQIKFEDSALEAAAKLSERYITDRFLPDKAIDLIDETAARKHIDALFVPPEIKELEDQVQELYARELEMANREQWEEAAKIKPTRQALEKKLEDAKSKWLRDKSTIVTEEDIAQTVSKWTGIPVAKMFEEEKEKLVHMEEELHKKIIGQDEAVRAISESIRRSRAGLKDPKRPIGSFIFLGPTGVGKTWLARVLAEFLFDDENAMVRIDMSEYMEKHTVSRMIGAPPGYVGYEEGGQLTEAVRRRPYRVILFDEIEKAHPDVLNVLLQILDDGRLTDAAGRTVDFKNTVIIMTSNLGSRHFGSSGRSLGFRAPGEEEKEYAQNFEQAKERVLQELRATLRPELLNRVDDILVFQPLSQEEIKQIVDLLVDQTREQLKERKINLELTEPAKELLAAEGFDKEYGARPLRRTIQKRLENPVSEGILRGEFKEGDTILADVENGKIVLKHKQPNPQGVE